MSQEVGRDGLSELFNAVMRAPDDDSETAKIRVQVLGQFRITVEGCDRSVPEGKASDLIKLLAVRLKSVPVDVVIDHLWSDVPTEVGTRRLKNVVSRARALIGRNGVERSGWLVRLDPDVEVDLAELRTKLTTFRASGHQDVDAAVQVVDRYTAPLLELDLYQDWITSERRSYATAAAGALEIVVKAGAKSAAWAFDAQVRIAPADHKSFESIAQIASSQGDRYVRQQCIDEVQRIRAALEVDPTAR